MRRLISLDGDAGERRYNSCISVDDIEQKTTGTIAGDLLSLDVRLYSRP
jgi:hypothetical protein